MEPLPAKINPQESKRKIFFKNFIAGIGWMTGATVGFTILFTVLGFVLKWLGGLPVFGEWLADIITWTNKALETHNSLPQ